MPAENDKVCPKCSTTMKAGEFEMVLPAAKDTRLGGNPISDKAGAALKLYYCPNCGFVELYYLASFRPV